MDSQPAPLPKGTVLAARFEIDQVLGRGGFGIVYLCHDRSMGDEVVVKELAPTGLLRARDGSLDLDRTGSPGHILRNQFIREAEILRLIHHAGVPTLRTAFVENGTAYHVSRYLSGSQTLEERIRRFGLLSFEDAREIFVSLLDVLERVHSLGLLHRDIKPSNVLLGPSGEVMLIDFGAARDWISDHSLTHTVMHTPGYAPPEQLSEKAPRTPATDIYGLCATAYCMLTGRVPETAADRMSGVELTPIAKHRVVSDPGFASAIEAGLALRASDRPQTVEQLRGLLRTGPEVTSELTLDTFVETVRRLRSFRYDRRGCPACGGVLVDPKPLRRGACPVCRAGIVRSRDIDEDRCPICRSGRLVELANEDRLAICPKCSTGRLTWHRRNVFSSANHADCRNCGAHFDWKDKTLILNGAERAASEEWRTRSGRAAKIRACEICDAQFDALPDGRWRQTVPSVNPPRLFYKEEWARIACNLPPGSGNSGCDSCGSDYWLDGSRLTLLDASTDPHGFAAEYLGQAIELEDLRWLAVGKQSGTSGLVCEACDTELDRDGKFLRLARSSNRRLSHHLGEPRVIEDWHRIAQALPTLDAEADYLNRAEELLRKAFIAGEVSFDDVGTAWSGKASRLPSDLMGSLVITQREISFGGLIRKWRAPIDAILGVEAEGERLSLAVSGEPDKVSFHVLPVSLRAHLPYGDVEVMLTAENLAERLRR